MHTLVITVKGFVAVVLIYFLSCLSAFAWEGYVTKALDGDSLRVRKGNRVYEIRLYGIDSPEDMAFIRIDRHSQYVINTS